MESLKQMHKKMFDARFEWDKIDSKLALKNTKLLDLIREACFIEAFFSSYVTHMLKLFHYDLDAIAVFTIESYEAYTHYYVTRRYLDTVGYRPVTDEEINKLKEKDKDNVYDDEIKELMNFMATEHFAANFFRDISETTEEPVLKNMMMDLSHEEVIHARFARDLLAKRLEKDPKLKDRIMEQATNYQHVGAYVLPAVSNVKEDNLKIIQSFNKMVENLTGESVSDYLARKG